MRTKSALRTMLTVLATAGSFAPAQASPVANSSKGTGFTDSGDNTGDATSNLSVLPSFTGIWVADGDEPMKLPAGCSLITRVQSKPAQLVRAVICANGNVETETAPITGITIEPSRFPDGFQFRAALGDQTSSCPDGQTSTIPALSSVAFDLKTGAGGEAATFAYTQLGDLEVALHSGGAIDTFNRNRDCSSITALAKNLDDSADNQLVKLAAKVCRIDAQATGCFTAAGFVPAAQ